MDGPYRYAAFISYSSKDAWFARKLHRALEQYRIPASLGQFRLTDSQDGRNRLYPCFRDREELPSGGLSGLIERALRDSRSLIVVCSPNAAASNWVETEIQYFANLGRSKNIFAVIVDGEPDAVDHNLECFPPFLRPTENGLRVLAGDVRPGGDGWRTAVLKLVAGIIGRSLGQVVDRDRALRRNTSIRLSLLGLVTLAVFVSLLNASENGTRRQVLLAEARQRLLVGDLQMARRLATTAAFYEPDRAATVAALEEVGLHFPTVALIPEGSRRRSVAASADLARIVTFGDAAPVIWNGTTGAPIARLGEVGGVERVSLSQDGSRLIAVDRHRQAALWDGTTGRQILDLGSLEGGATVSGNGEFAFVATHHGTSLWNTRTGAQIAHFGLRQPREYAFSADAATALMIWSDGSASLWNVTQRRMITDFLGRASYVQMAPDGSCVTTLERHPRSRRPRLVLWDGRDGSRVNEFLSGNVMTRPVISPTCDRVFTPGHHSAAPGFPTRDSPGTLWDPRTGSATITFPQGGTSQGAVFSGDGARLVALGDRGNASLWDTHSGQLVRTLEPAVGAWFSADGARVITLNTDGSLALIEPTTGAVLARVFGANVIPTQRPGAHVVPSQDGRSVLAFDGKGVGYVLDLTEVDRARPSWRSVCITSGRHLSPFTDQERRLERTGIRGRPWHPCLWRPLTSWDGWAQEFRYRLVNIGVEWDYMEDECSPNRRSFGCPASSFVDPQI